MAKKIFKNKSINDLQYRAEELKAELFALKFWSATGQLEKIHRIKELRREVAKILTHLQMRKDSGEVVKPLNQKKVIFSETFRKEIDQKTKIIEKKAKPKLKKKKLVVEKKDNVVAKQVEFENQKLVAKEIKKIKDVIVPVMKEKKDYKPITSKDNKEASVKTSKFTKSKSITLGAKTNEKRSDNNGKK